MKRKQINETVFCVIEEQVLERQLYIDRNENMEFGENGYGIDSLGYIKLILLLEKIYEIEMDEYVYDHNIIKTVCDLTEYIYSNIKCDTSIICLSDIIRNNLTEYGLHIALIQDDNKITYSELYKDISALTALLINENISENDSMLIYLPNSIEFVIVFFALTNLGCNVILVDIKLTHELDHILSENGVTGIFTSKRYFSKLEKTDENRCIFDISKLLVKACESVSRNKEEFCKSNNNSSVILYTSGSEGGPKPVRNSIATLYGALCSYKETVPITSEDVLVGIVPFYHSYGFGSCLLEGLACGAAIILIPQFIPSKLINMMKKYKATVFHGVPYMYKLLVELLDNIHKEIPKLRLCVSAGGYMPDQILDLFYQKTGLVIHQEYGSTETGTIAFNVSDSIQINKISVGKPLANVQVRAAVNSTQIEGNIQVKSPGMSHGYIGEPDIHDEWYATGDIGFIDSEGYIHLIGREKRLISISGLKVNPYEIENIIKLLDEVENVLVIGVHHEEYGEAVKAMVELKDLTLSKEKLMNHCKKYLAVHKLPKYIEWVATLHTSSTGKTMYMD